LTYFAWPKGPVPKELYEELDEPKPDFARAITVQKANLSDPDERDLGLKIIPRIAFSAQVFTTRELRMMERLAEIYRDAGASDMVEVTHLAGRPWHEIFELQKRPQAQIPYELALDGKQGSITKEQADLIAAEAREVAALFD